MRRVLISDENTWWQNGLGCLAAIIIIPVAIVVKLIIMPFERPIHRSPAEVARYLRDFIEGTGGDWDYDDFESIPIADPRLDAIRDRATRVREPMSAEGFAILRGLLEEAEALAENRNQCDGDRN